MNRAMKDKTINETLEYYNNNSEQYAENTMQVDMNYLYKEFLMHIDKGGNILDLGCGSGRDSKAFIDMEYKVTAIDGSQELAKIASKIIGKEVIVSTFEELELDEKFQGIWACASLLHIKKEGLKRVLNNLYNNLENNGVFYMSFKYGDKEYIDDKNRYFNCFTGESIINFINENTKFNILDLYITEDKLGRRNEVKWVNIICTK